MPLIIHWIKIKKKTCHSLFDLLIANCRQKLKIVMFF